MRLPSRITIECDVPEGIETVAADEVRERLPEAERIGSAPGKIWFEVMPARLANVVQLRTVAGAWIVERYKGRRPSVLLSDRRLTERVRLVVRSHGSVRAFALSAPGSGSSAMREVRAALARATGLRDKPDGLLVRLRRRPGGWDALVAIAPRPMAERTWRVVRSPGALNGALAAAIVRLTRPEPTDRFLNVACGSGTIAIERRLHGPASDVVGLDVAAQAIASSVTNVRASGVSVALVMADARALPFPRATFDVVCADLPWGFEVGSHDRNVDEYRKMLIDMGRICVRRARACVLTAETRLMQRVLGELAALWRLDCLMRVEQGGARPGLFVMRRA